MSNTAPGWYPDPDNAAAQRYWDGSSWTEHRHDPNAPAATTPPPPPSAPVQERRINGLGIAAIIIGAVALIFGVIPILSFIAWLPALVAIGLGIGGLVQKNRSKIPPLIGLILGVIAIIVGIIVTIAFTAAVAGGVSNSLATASAKAAEPVVVVYSVTSDAGTAQDITYSTFDTDNSGTQQAQGAPVPWTKSVTVKRGGTFDYKAFTLVAQASADATTITCTITVNGKSVSTNTSTGAYAVATCNASGSDLGK